jgi:hypothetical protein
MNLGERGVRAMLGMWLGMDLGKGRELGRARRQAGAISGEGFGNGEGLQSWFVGGGVHKRGVSKCV